jgi:hypothetical protein
MDHLPVLPRSTLCGLMFAAALIFPVVSHAVSAISTFSPASPASIFSVKAPGPTPRAGAAFRDRQGGGMVRAPGRPHAGPNRLGDRECCKTPDCRCGCLYSLVGTAVAALRA